MRNISPELYAQFYSQESNDPFLVLLTLSHPSFAEDFRIVNNTKDITSRGNVFFAFPVKITLPVDDGETIPSVKLSLDNIGRELVDELRSINDFITVKLEMILASLPDEVQIEIYDMKLSNATFSETTISGTLFLDDFMNTQLNVETYGPSNYKAIF